MSNEIQFILYQLPDEEGKIQVVIKDETIWATQKAMAALFDVGVPDISKHLKKKFETGELDKNTTISKMETVVNRGIRGNVLEDVVVSQMEIAIRTQRVQTLQSHAANRLRLRQRSERPVRWKGVDISLNFRIFAV